MTTLNLTSKTWESVVTSKLPVVVNFSAPMCSYCKALAPVFEELAKEYDGRAVFAKMNIFDSPDIAERYNIKSVPVIKIFCAGKEVDGFIGFAPRELLQEFIEQAISKELACVR